VPRLYRSSGIPGYLSEISGDPRHIIGRKLEREVQVQFADRTSTVQTPEGAVQAQPGDAILTGIAGERWRVSHRHFANKYRPAADTRAGEPGTYLSLRNRILALRMNEPFEVLLADGVSRLNGRPGDWLVDYGDGSLGVISDAIFQVTYEIPD
jgi:PGDYG protein